MKLIKQGAEADIYLDEEKGTITKDRIKKSYRLADIDRKIRKLRTRSEAKLLEKSRERGISVPQVLSKDENKIVMEYIPGNRVKDILKKENVKDIMARIGKIIAKLHSNDIIHGDLTTSNFILKKNQIYIFDFGLGSISNSIEKKAVDIHLFEEALDSTHTDLYEEGLGFMIDAYKKNYDGSDSVLKRLSQIRTRGRYVKR
ncbi:MAG: KEOPS complex kinase/ATPase Bud32 [archaeon]